jgi:hypothetical protein
VDLYDLTSLRLAIKGADVVVRLTTKIGSLSGMRGARAWGETNRLRTTGARVLVDAAIAEGVKVYVHESVTFVYRDGGANWLTEDSPTDDTESAVLAAALEGEQEPARFSRRGARSRSPFWRILRARGAVDG